MVDNMKKINFSSFLKNGNILLRCDYRYLIFDQDGYYLNQPIFSDFDDRKGENDDDENDPKNY